MPDDKPNALDPRWGQNIDSRKHAPMRHPFSVEVGTKPANALYTYSHVLPGMGGQTAEAMIEALL